MIFSKSWIPIATVFAMPSPRPKAFFYYNPEVFLCFIVYHSRKNKGSVF